MCIDQKKMSDQKQPGNFDLPGHLIPEYRVEKVCTLHGNTFQSDDSALKICARSVIVYDADGETYYDSTVYYRDTAGQCKCQQNPPLPHTICN